MMYSLEEGKRRVMLRKVKGYETIVMMLRTMPESDIKITRQMMLDEAAKVSKDVANIYDNTYDMKDE